MDLNDVLESLHSFIRDGILICEAEPIADPGPTIIFANQAFLRMAGYTLEEILGRTPRIFQGPETDPDALADIRKSLTCRQHVRTELINYRKDGSPYWVDLSIFPVHDPYGQYHYWVSVQRDRTELHRQQEALDWERKLNGLQRQFVAMVSHEFRTPLSVIDGCAQSLWRKREALSSERLEAAINKIRRSVCGLTELMESVLASARMENGTIKFDPQSCALKDLLGEIIEGYQLVNPDYKIIKDFSDLPDEILADAKLLRQVFSNIMSNAIKYSPDAKTIWIKGAVEPSEQVSVSIRDQGVGIPKPELAKLFERFYRASTSIGIAGTGIGLHLAQHIMEMHHGAIRAESEEGKGSTFTVILPIDSSSDSSSFDKNAIQDEPASVDAV